MTVTQSSRAEPGLTPELRGAYVRLLEERYFTATDKRWRLVDPVRRMVRFAQLNLAQTRFRTSPAA